MRLGWLTAIFMSTLLLLIVGVHIMVKTFQLGGVIDWMGMSAFVLGILSGLAGLGFAKAQQKRFETPMKPPNEPDNIE